MTRLERLTLIVLWCITGLIFAALYLPALLVVFQSFFDRAGRSIAFDSFGLKWYRALLDNGDILSALGTSLIVGCAAVAVSASLALLIAYYMKTGERRGRRYVEFVIFMPFVLPAIITGIALLITFRELGIESGILTVTLGHIAIILAVLYRMITVRLESLEDSQIEAALDLGANHRQAFLFVVLPQLRSALITSSLLAFTLSFDETLVTFFLSGSDMTIPIRLWSMMRVGFSPEVNAFVSLVLLVTMTTAVLSALSFRNPIVK
ncbi:ABC transporter permease [Taklimakanibacter deserti]|uniref:ABC transporter permease n=1 Tax=Taklimakanibacter deserti TaxID=2267839 RepID=UPI000E647837